MGHHGCGGQQPFNEPLGYVLVKLDGPTEKLQKSGRDGGGGGDARCPRCGGAQCRGCMAPAAALMPEVPPAPANVLAAAARRAEVGRGIFVAVLSMICGFGCFIWNV